MDVIKTGTILIENCARLPRSLVLTSEPYSRGWTTVTNLRSDFVRDIDQAGWTFFFLAGQIQATVFGFIRVRARKQFQLPLRACGSPPPANLLRFDLRRAGRLAKGCQLTRGLRARDAAGNALTGL